MDENTPRSKPFCSCVKTLLIIMIIISSITTAFFYVISDAQRNQFYKLIKDIAQQTSKKFENYKILSNIHNVKNFKKFNPDF